MRRKERWKIVKVSGDQIHSIAQTTLLGGERTVDVEEIGGDIDTRPAGLGQDVAEMKNIRAGATTRVERRQRILCAAPEDALHEAGEVHSAAIRRGKLSP